MLSVEKIDPVVWTKMGSPSNLAGFFEVNACRGMLLQLHPPIEPTLSCCMWHLTGNFKTRDAMRRPAAVALFSWSSAFVLQKLKSS